MKKVPKIVMRNAFPVADEFVLYLEKDNHNEVYCTLYKENIHMTQKEIASAIGYTEAAVCKIIKKGLSNIFRIMKRKNKHLNPIEVTALIGELLNVKTDVQYKRYFQALPNDIKDEVIEYANQKNY